MMVLWLLLIFAGVVLTGWGVMLRRAERGSGSR